MIYTASIETLKNRAAIKPLRTVLTVTSGLIWRIEAEFPPGCSGLLHCQIFDGSYQLFPASPGESIHSDAHVLGFDDLYLKTSGPFEFVVHTWNLDETHPHGLQVRIGMAHSEAEMSRYMPLLTWENFSRVMAQAQADQDALKEIQKQALIDQIGDL